MSPFAMVTALACVGHLGLLILVSARGARNALTFPFALLLSVLFAWRFASLAYELTWEDAWTRVAYVVAALVGPSAFLFVLTYLGRRRQLRAYLIASWAVFGAISVVALLWWLRLPSLSLFTWATLHLSAIAAVTIAGLALLAFHLRETVLEAERLRTRILMTGLALLPLLGITDLLNAMLGGFPRLASAGTLIASGLLARVALGLDLFGQRRWVTLGYGWLLGIIGITAYLSLMLALGSLGAVAAFVVTTVALVIAGAARQVMIAAAERRARIAQFATLGRVSAQMAHDLKNPLAALKGAAQYLQQERTRGKDLNASGEMIDLMSDQIDRIHHVIDTYQRLGRVQAVRSSVQLNDLVARVCALQSLAPPAGVRVEQKPAKELPPCSIDPDLVASALENLVRNGLQAMPRGGVLTVGTAPGEDAGSVALWVEDTGVGMDPRTRERAFDPFFTTKADGSGMGLAFVRRVVEAHHGSIGLSSREGEGTQIRLVFHVAEEPLPDLRESGAWIMVR